ncbi:hypothetical protein ACFOWX_03340 [Sphingorhabdus arenilitoris]|uniref:DUF4935 domain-containing protein n=1 Tax=Sphingorhabdus arenilitoris TaxID=1490041 RepID=A0ABV8RDW0_9SPHN
MAIYFLDTNTLQALIESGQYEAFRRAAAARGIELATTRTVIDELGRGTPSQAVQDFRRNAQQLINVEVDPFGPIDVYRRENRNAGELGLAELVQRQLQAGNDAVLITQEVHAIRSFRAAYGSDFPLASVGELPGFTGGNSGNDPVQAPVRQINNELFANDPLFNRSLWNDEKSHEFSHHRIICTHRIYI